MKELRVLFMNFGFVKAPKHQQAYNVSRTRTCTMLPSTPPKNFAKKYVTLE